MVEDAILSRATHHFNGQVSWIELNKQLIHLGLVRQVNNEIAKFNFRSPVRNQRDFSEKKREETERKNTK
jgi:hypothetical protein